MTMIFLSWSLMTDFPVVNTYDYDFSDIISNDYDFPVKMTNGYDFPVIWSLVSEFLVLITDDYVTPVMITDDLSWSLMSMTFLPWSVMTFPVMIANDYDFPTMITSLLLQIYSPHPWYQLAPNRPCPPILLYEGPLPGFQIDHLRTNEQTRNNKKTHKKENCILRSSK